MNENEGRWVTINGKHVFIKDGQSPMDAFLKSQVNKEQNVKGLTESEYQELCDQFEKSLTKEEKENIEHYSISGGYSMDANDPNYQRTLLVENPIGSGKYEEKRLPYGEWLSNDIELNEAIHNDKNNEYYVGFSFSYDRVQEGRKYMKTMDQIIENKGVSLDKDIRVYRKGFESYDDLVKGVQRKGFTSTSYKSRINKKTPGGLSLGENEFEIIVPAGTKFMPIRNMVPNDIKGQNEIVLPRNLNFELVEDMSTGLHFDSKKMKMVKGKNKYVVKVRK